MRVSWVLGIDILIRMCLFFGWVMIINVWIKRLVGFLFN